MASNPQHEPTMEEILASIRKIISEDSGESSDQMKANGAQAGADTEVYELREADMVDAPVAGAAPEPVRVVPLTPKPEPVVYAHEEPSVNASVSAASANGVQAESSDGFFSDQTRKAMHETFARLEPVQPEESPSAAPSPSMPAPEGSTVQAVFEHAVREKFGPVVSEYLHAHVDEVVERMKPLVREWMDEHFPAILEGVVRNEVERAVKAAAASKQSRR